MIRENTDQQSSALNVVKDNNMRQSCRPGRVRLHRNRLLELRQGLGLSQEQVADECQQQRLYVSVSSLKRAELQRYVLLRTANNLSRFYNVPVEELIVAEDASEPETPASPPEAPAVVQRESNDPVATPIHRKVLGLCLAGELDLRSLAPMMDELDVAVHYSSSSFHVLLLGAANAHQKPTAYAMRVIRAIARRHPDIVALVKPIQAEFSHHDALHCQARLPMSERLGIERFAKQQLPGVVLVHSELFHCSRLEYSFVYKSNPAYAPGPWYALTESMPPVLHTIGREQERAYFQSLLIQLKAEGEGAWCNISGVAGIGKTHLALAFVEEAAKQNLSRVILRNTCDDKSKLHPGAELIRRLANLQEVDENKLLNLLVNFCIDSHWYPFIYHLFGVKRNDPHPNDWMVASMSPYLFQKSCQQALETLLIALLGQRELIVVIEEIHQLDEDMRLTLEALANLTPYCPLLLITSSYSDFIAGFDQHDVKTIRLFPLTQPQARELAHGHGAASEEWREHCVLKAQGHPSFLIDLLNHEHLGDELPFSITNIIAAKTERLSARLKCALELISVSQDGFTQPQLEELMGGPLERFATLLSLGVLHPHGERWFFTHNLLREAVYQSMPEKVRRERHAMAAEWIRERDPVQYAIHLAKSGSDQALPELLAAAERLIQDQHFKQAKQLLLLAEPFLRDAKCKCKAYRMLALTLKSLGETDKGVKAALSAIDHCSDERDASYDWRILAEMYYQLGRTEDALHALNCAEILTERYHQHELGARLYELHSEILLSKGHVVASQEYRKIAMKTAMKSDHCPPKCDIRQEGFSPYGGLGPNMPNFAPQTCMNK
ncbi:predicted ATPase [Hahella chejuensis KCTC 2396]|uniref:Predicted ATPase n=1 Tax=Hahella chejuensis (strain KCTC 2396) TaxID=349521 RepID=Q2SC06_HAHCH|nr:AAA family ATPase [Hahella chejuensis]ABC31818.1 predicted ATPase [Hahella chejuensis KCTC 2396]